MYSWERKSDDIKEELFKSIPKQIPSIFNHKSDFGFKKITQILCNKICILALSGIYLLKEDGKLYSWGDDTENQTGLLGLGDIYYQQSPVLNPEFINYHLTNISLSNKHACAFDQSIS